MQWSLGSGDILPWRLMMEQEVVRQVDLKPIINHGAVSLLFYWPVEICLNQMIGQLQQIYLQMSSPLSLNPRTWEFPVWYDIEHPDFQTVLSHTKWSAEELIKAHCQRFYRVEFLGFLPGFPYLSGLDPKLSLSRKRTPERSIAPGTVAIANNYCGIYPNESPAGWYALGRCPVKLFEPDDSSPMVLSTGDQLIFKPVSASTYSQLKQQRVDPNSFIKQADEK
ncbi:5-oxoprolinase subunit B family protein [Nonlabens xiamenensis]|uniref:5-oxoprolinase subunit B family protein n=1 Tax=Nonlabens xiamenensis TaxID=2341043 RepID=UPI000F60B334|nr:carboxyltransferase domain-containing protein [Nonlabens xiamenensis]